MPSGRLDKFDTIFDVLVLDVALGVDHFGGIDFHNKLVDGGYRRRWRNVFIWTMHTYSDIANAVYKQSGSNNEQYILRVFCETAGIPYLNVWPPGSAEMTRWSYVSAKSLTPPPTDIAGIVDVLMEVMAERISILFSSAVDCGAHHCH